MRPRWRRDRHATASLLALVCACGVFSLAFVTVVHYAVESPRGFEPSDHAELSADAATLANAVFGSSASSMYGDASCADRSTSKILTPPASSVTVLDDAVPDATDPYDPDGMSRFGLADDGCSTAFQLQATNGLDYGAYLALRGGRSQGSDPANQKADYDEVYAAMRLAPTALSFHLDGTVVTTRSDYPDYYAPMRMNTLYLGHFTSALAPTAVCIDASKLPLNVVVNCITFPVPTCILACTFVTSAASSTLREAQYLRAIQPTFSPYLAAGTDATNVIVSAGGDILADFATSLDANLCLLLRDGAGMPSLVQYNSLVVGSDFTSTAMSAVDAQCVYDWTLAGGFLLVFGTTGYAGWARTTFKMVYDHESTASSQAPSLAPDVAAADQPLLRPLLTVPNVLDWPQFTDGSPRSAWYSTSEGSYHAVLLGSVPVQPMAGKLPLEGDSTKYAHLWESDFGALGNGRAVFTSWKPATLTASTADDCNESSVTLACTEVKAIQDLFTVSLKDLGLSFGPQVPTQKSVGTSQRVMTVIHPFLQDAVEVRLTLTLWRDTGATPGPTTTGTVAPPTAPPPPSGGGGGCGLLNVGFSDAFEIGCDDLLPMNDMQSQ